MFVCIFAIKATSVFDIYFSWTYFLKSFLCLQSLPRIDLDNYSALPVDEGDEDREAGIGDEEDEGSDLEIGDDPASAGKLIQMNNSSNPAGCMSDECSYKLCSVFCLCRGEG